MRLLTHPSERKQWMRGWTVLKVPCMILTLLVEVLPGLCLVRSSVVVKVLRDLLTMSTL